MGFSPKERPMAKERARIGVIGTGWWATTAHLPGLTAHPDAEIVGVADLDRDKARQTADRYGIARVFADHRDLLALEPDGVVVVTPHDTHYSLVRDALLAGSDVLVEKPMVIEPAHARELVELARARGRNLHVGYPYPYTRHSQLLRDLILAGELGEILFVTSLFATQPHPLYRGNTVLGEAPALGAMWWPGKDTYSEPSRGGGQLLTQVTHSASLLFFLTGLRPVDVHAFTSNYDTRVDVWDAVTFRTAEGAVGSVASTGTVALTQQTVEEIRIFGSKGHAAIDTTRGTLTVFAADGGIREETPLAADERYPLQKPSHQLVDVILGRGDVLVPGELGRLTVDFLAAARESARSGRIVAMPAASGPG
jgi:predicted dehydrogenase